MACNSILLVNCSVLSSKRVYHVFLGFDLAKCFFINAFFEICFSLRVVAIWSRAIRSIRIVTLPG